MLAETRVCNKAVIGRFQDELLIIPSAPAPCRIALPDPGLSCVTASAGAWLLDEGDQRYTRSS